jgi:hypothetical protein
MRDTRNTVVSDSATERFFRDFLVRHVLITSGPVMNMYDVSFTMTLKSVIAGL